MPGDISLLHILNKSSIALFYNNEYYLHKWSNPVYNRINKSAFECIYKEIINMSIGNTIKKMRRERDITQEQLAEYIGISAQAVSQWECDKTAPDISQLPVIAHIFGVTTDEILEVDIQRNDEKIKAILDEAHVFCENGDFTKSAGILEDGLKKFPRSFKIMVELAHSLGSVYGKSKETIELCKKIIAECTDNTIRSEATQELIYAYANSGDRKSALRMARELSEAWFSREDFLMRLLYGHNDKEREEAKANLQSYAEFCANRLMVCMMQLAMDKQFGYTDEERINLLESAVTVAEAVYPDGDYHFYAHTLEDVYDRLKAIYADRKDAENTLKVLEKEADACIHFCTYDQKAVHTSPAVRGLCDGGWVPSSDGNRCNEQLNDLRSSERYDFIRPGKRFEAIIAKLEKYAV